MGGPNVEHGLEICGLPCQVLEQRFDEVVCRTPMLRTPALLAAFPAPGGDLRTASEAVLEPYDYWTQRLFFDGDLAELPDLSTCNVGLRLTRGQLGYIEELRFYPAVLNWQRDELIGGVFEARNSSDWVTLHTIRERPRGGWNAVPIPPIVAQEVRCCQSSETRTRFTLFGKR